MENPHTPQSIESALVESEALIREVQDTGTAHQGHVDVGYQNRISGEVIVPTEDGSARLGVYPGSKVIQSEINTPQGTYKAHSDDRNRANIVRVDRGEYQHKFQDPEKRKRAAILLQQLVSKPIRAAVDASTEKHSA
jgi:hypothetical protein